MESKIAISKHNLTKNLLLDIILLESMYKNPNIPF